MERTGFDWGLDDKLGGILRTITLDTSFGFDGADLCILLDVPYL